MIEISKNLGIRNLLLKKKLFNKFTNDMLEHISDQSNDVENQKLKSLFIS